MVYLNIKKYGGKKYYSLRESQRKGKKVISKEICSLGSDISKININKIKQKCGRKFKKSAKNIIKVLESEKILQKLKNKPKKAEKYFSRRQLNEINSTLISYLKKSTKNNNKNNKSKQINLKFIKEGISMDSHNRLSLKQIEEVAEKEKKTSRINLRDSRYITNIKNILKFLKNQNPKLDLNLIKKINTILLENVFRINGFRKDKITFQNKIKVSPGKKIESDLKLILSWYNSQKNKIHPLALSILFHHKFEKIHPFWYGNGETGKIIINYMLSQFNYPPIIIPSRLKHEYFHALHNADKAVKKDLLSTDMRYYKPLMDFMQKCFVKTYWDNFVV